MAKRGLRLWVVLRLWRNGVYVCGQFLRLWVVCVCGRYRGEGPAQFSSMI